MLLILIPFFLLTAAMTGGLAYFAGRYVFTEVPVRRLRLARSATALAAAVFPLVYFGLYMMAEPTEEGAPEVSANVALIPAVWVGLLLLGVAVGLTFASGRRTAGAQTHPSP